MLPNLISHGGVVLQDMSDEFWLEDSKLVASTPES